VITVNARELMAPPQKCLAETDSVVLAARRMRALGVSTVPVSDRQNGFIGMLSDRDIVERCVADAVNPGEMPVGDLVQGPQQCVKANRVADSSVLGLVLRQPLGVLPVVEDGILVGVLTLAGMAGHLIDDTDLDGSAGQPWWPVPTDGC